MATVKTILRKLPAVGEAARLLRSLARSPGDCARAFLDRLRWFSERTRGPRLREVARAGGGLHVTFVATAPTVREAKLARAARSLGARVSLVSEVERTSEQREPFDTVVVVRNAWDALIALDHLAADVAHFVVELGDRHRWVRDVMRRARVPVVYDQYDCFAGMLRPGCEAPSDVLETERQCFEAAHAICSRHLEPLVLRREHGFRLPPAIYFPDYCRSAPRCRQSRDVSSNDELQVVYCGGVWPEDRFAPGEFAYAQYIGLARALAAQRIHLHLFPAPHPAMLEDFEGFFSLYFDEARRNPFLHLHRPCSHAKLVARLPEFDAALHVFGTGIGKDPGRNTAAKIRYSSANKLFDYIEAGLPVIIHEGLHQRGVVRHFGQAICLETIDDARASITLALGGTSSPNRASCSITAQAPRLLALYERLAGKRCPRVASRADTSIEETFAGVPAEEIRKIVSENSARLYGFD